VFFPRPDFVLAKTLCAGKEKFPLKNEILTLLAARGQTNREARARSGISLAFFQLRFPFGFAEGGATEGKGNGCACSSSMRYYGCAPKPFPIMVGRNYIAMKRCNGGEKNVIKN
jgi:hypothetical protein